MMTLENLYTAALLVALFVFSVWVTRLINRQRTPEQKVRLHSDTAGPQSEEDRVIQVRFSKSGKQFPWEPGHDSLLEFAESKGIEIDFQCREGECGTCETRLLSGEVGYRQQPKIVLRDDRCLMCISIPTSDVTLEG